MSTQELGSLALALLLLVLGVTLLGQLFARFRQPKVVGEILAGVLLGPTLLGQFVPGTAASLFGDGPKDPSATVLGFLYHLGLLLLMFISGASVRHVLGKENRSMKGIERERLAVPLESLSQVSAAGFIPIYFAIVGYRLDFTKSFSPVLLVAFLVGSSLVVLVSIGLATRQRQLLHHPGRRLAGWPGLAAAWRTLA
jgi:Kef-type K+ transport system membrane component KefB